MSSLLSGFADQQAICSQPPPSLLGTSSHILSIPQLSASLLCPMLPSVLSDQHGEGALSLL